MKFKIGDIVEWCGVRGKVVHIDNNHKNPIRAEFPIELNYSDEFLFTENGNFCKWHKEPSLKLIERPKKKVKKEIKVWLNIYPNRPYDGCIGNVYDSQLAADERAAKDRIACVELTGQYEIEE